MAIRITRNIYCKGFSNLHSLLLFSRPDHLDPPPLEIGIRILHSLPAKTSPHRRPPEPMKYPDASGQEVHLLYSVNMTAPDTSAKKQEDTPHGAKNALFTAVGRV